MPMLNPKSLGKGESLKEGIIKKGSHPYPKIG